MPDVWTTDGVTYTMDAKPWVGGVITAQREGKNMTYSRVVSKVLTREEAEKLFEADISQKEPRVPVRHSFNQNDDV